MRLPPLIIADAEPLIGLAKIGHLQLLKRLYHTVLIPPTVRAELKPESNYQGSDALKAALNDGVAETPAADLLVSLQQILDPREAEAIALAQQSESASLIIDERRGRNVAVHRKISLPSIKSNMIFTCSDIPPHLQPNKIEGLLFVINVTSQKN